MSTEGIWLIDHKATLGDFSPMNLDGSSWILGVCVIAASSEEDAAMRFNRFLEGEGMEVIEIYDLRLFHESEFIDESSRTKQIRNAVRTVSQDGETCYVYARTSETMACEGNK